MTRANRLHISDSHTDRVTAAVVVPTPTHPVPSRRALFVATGAVIVALIGLNLGQHFWPGQHLWVGPTAAAALLLFARWRGLSWTQLGLGRHRLRSGVAWGAAAIAAVGLVYLVGIALPLTRSVFLDSRYHLGVPEALLSAFVIIPLGTVLLEEVAFRSVLWGMVARHARTWRVLVITSMLFGLWHVLSSLNLSSANAGVGDALRGAGAAAGVVAVVATVAFTTAGGVVIGELRRRSQSVLASAGLHWATNALGVLFGIVAWKLVG